MTLQEILTYTDELHDNNFSNELKTRWVNECEARIQTGIMLLPENECVHYSYPVDLISEMIAPPPFDEIYTAYLDSKLFYAYNEVAGYQNAMKLYNSLFDSFSIWYAEKYDPVHGGQMPAREEWNFVCGETVSHRFKLDCGKDDLSSLYISFLYGGECVLQLTIDDCDFDGWFVLIKLSQEQTLSLPAGLVRVSITGVMLSGERFETWPPYRVRVYPTAVHEVIA